jgi:ribosomal protein S16
MLSVAPLVALGSDAGIDEGSLFQQACSFTDDDGSAWTGTVDYGDGSAAEALTINANKTFALQHAYGGDGDYTITVAITNDLNDTGTDSLLLAVENIAPSLTVIGSQTLSSPGLWSARDLGTFVDPCFGGETFTYSIDWGDESPVDSGPATVRVAGGLDLPTQGSFDGSHYFGAPATYTVTMTVADSDGGLDTESFQVTVAAAPPETDSSSEGVPVVTASDRLPSESYVVTGPTTPIDPELTVSDADDEYLSSATVSISSNYIAGEDELRFTDQLGISGDWDAATGRLTLSTPVASPATVADFQTALRSVTYVNQSLTPSPWQRTVSFTVTEVGTEPATSEPATSLVTVNVAQTVYQDAGVQEVPSWLWLPDGMQSIEITGISGAVVLADISIDSMTNTLAYTPTGNATGAETLWITLNDSSRCALTISVLEAASVETSQILEVGPGEAYGTIKAALRDQYENPVAQAGDTIVVHSGVTYTDCLLIEQTRVNIVAACDYTSDPRWATEHWGDEPRPTIDVGYAGIAVTFQNVGAGPETAKLKGFVIQNASGSGVSITNSAGIQIEGCTIQNNHNDTGLGGGILISSSTDVSVGTQGAECYIQHNTAWSGGGVEFDVSSGSISNSHILYNTCARFSGGIGLDKSHNVTIERNTIRFNQAYGQAPLPVGGGILASRSTEVSVLNNIAISDNWGGQSGGGVSFMFGTTGTISGNTIEHNEAAFGGGIYFENATNYVATPGVTVSVTGNTIRNNSACAYYQDKYADRPYRPYDENAEWLPGGGGYGGGICLTSWSRVEFIDNDIVDNTADFGGGGVSSYDDSLLILKNNRINRNKVPITTDNPLGVQAGRGGGLYIGGNVTLEDNLICDNFARSFGGASLYGNVANVTLTHNTFSNNSSTVHTGGVGLFGVNGTLTGNTFASNTIDDEEGVPYTFHGGNLYIAGCNLTLVNNLIQGGEAAAGAGIYVGVPDGYQPINVPWHSNIELTNNTIAQNDGGGLLIESMSSREFHAVAGSWEGGNDSLGLLEDRAWYLEDRATFDFGVLDVNTYAVAGDWAWEAWSEVINGTNIGHPAVSADGIDTVGVYYTHDIWGVVDGAPALLVPAGTFLLSGGMDGRGESYRVLLQVDAGVDYASCIPIAGDWDGVSAGSRHTDRVGLYDPVYRKLYREGLSPLEFPSVGADWIPIAGDWNGPDNGGNKDMLGFYDPEESEFYLPDDSGQLPPEGFAVDLAAAGLQPIAGDWDGDGPQFDTVGLFDPTGGCTYYLNANAATALASGAKVNYLEYSLQNNIIATNTQPDVSGANYDSSNWVGDNPQFVNTSQDNFRLQSNSACVNTGVAGEPLTDIDGNLRDGQPDKGAYEYVAATATTSVGLYDPSDSTFSLCYSNGTVSDDCTFGYGFLPISGDWDGNGSTTQGLYDPATSYFYLWNSNTTAGVFDLSFGFGEPGAGWLPIAGDWDGPGPLHIDTVGLYDPTSSTFYLQNMSPLGYHWQIDPQAQGWVPIAGDWDHNGTDTIGIYARPNDVIPITPKFYLADSNTAQTTSELQPIIFSLSNPADEWPSKSSIPVVGDWVGWSQGEQSYPTYTVGLYDTQQSRFYLCDGAGVSATPFTFGTAGQVCLPIAGEWVCPELPEAKHRDTIGLYNPTTSQFTLRNSNETGSADATFSSGSPSRKPIAGDWNGDGIVTVGLYDPATRHFSLRNSDTADAAQVDFAFSPTGAADTWIPLAGDWDGDGVDSIGLYDPSSSWFYLQTANVADQEEIQAFGFGQTGWLPIAGDWDGDGDDTIGLYDPSVRTFYLKNSNEMGYADVTIDFDNTTVGASWLPIAGDWDSDGKHTIGFYNVGSGDFILRNSLMPGAADRTIQYAPAGRTSEWKPLVGDWNGHGSTDVGVYDPSSSTFHLRSFLSVMTDYELDFEQVLLTVESTWKPITGDWDGDLVDTVGFFDPSEATFHLRDSDGRFSTVDLGSEYIDWLPFAGDWDGDGTDTVGVFDKTTGRFVLRDSSGADFGFVFAGATGSNVLPVAGDWDGDFCDTVGIYDRDSCWFFMCNSTIAEIEEQEEHVVVADASDQFTGMAEADAVPVAGNWDAAGGDWVGIYNPTDDSYSPSKGYFILRSACLGPTTEFVFLGTTNIALLGVAGDWNGNGADTVGVYNPGTYVSSRYCYFLANTLGTPAVGADTTIYTVPRESTRVSGDWNGDGLDTIGYYDPLVSRFYLRNSNTVGQFDSSIFLNCPGWLPIVGDWNGVDPSGRHIDNVGAYDPATGNFYIRVADVLQGPYSLGRSNCIPLAGDWNGDGVDTYGVYDPSDSHFYLTNTIGAASQVDFCFGRPESADPEANWVPITGDWDGDFATSVGLYDPANSVCYLKNSNAAGAADRVFHLMAENAAPQSGSTSPLPLAGRWFDPAQPGGLTASDGAHDKVFLDWDDVPGVTGYVLYRTTTNNVAGASFIGGTIASHFDDEWAAPGTTYYYWVRSYTVLSGYYHYSAFSAVDSGYCEEE